MQTGSTLIADRQQISLARGKPEKDASFGRIISSQSLTARGGIDQDEPPDSQEMPILAELKRMTTSNA